MTASKATNGRGSKRPARKDARQRQILQALERSPSLRVNELAERAGVSTETIRRDLDELTARGAVDRTYGGAVRRPAEEPGVGERHKLHVAEREAIARRAVPLLKGARHLMIGSGATTVHVARRLAIEANNLIVLAHSFGVATVLSLNPTITVLMAPGVYHAGEGAVHGAATLRFLSDYRADAAVLGASGLAPDGPTDALIEAAEVYACMARRSAECLVVADRSKFNAAFPARYAAWPDVDRLITDQPPAGALAAALNGAGVAVEVA